MRTSRLLAALAATAVAGGLVMAPAQAAAPKPTTIAKGLITPLRAAIAPDGTAYVSQNFIGSIVKVKKGKKPKTIYQAKQEGAEAGAVSLRGSKLTFAVTPADAIPPDARLSSGRALLRSHLTRARSAAAPSATVYTYDTKRGKTKKLADVGAFENAKNPDKNVYGIVGLDEECATALSDAGLPFLLPYSGEPYSHPYATTSDGKHTYLADAGANDVVSIDGKGKVKAVAVLPRVKLVLDEHTIALLEPLLEGAELPDCVTGLSYYGEPVPTDIERGKDGKLYVSTLGGGVGEALPLGSVYRIDPKSGKTTKVAGGLFAPTGLAIDAKGGMYVSQLFTGEILKLKKGGGKPSTFASTMMPAEVEAGPGGIWATTKAMAEAPPFGSLVRFKG